MLGVLLVRGFIMTLITSLSQVMNMLIIVRITCHARYEFSEKHFLLDGGDEELEDLGVKVALSMLKFYKSLYPQCSPCHSSLHFSVLLLGD